MSLWREYFDLIHQASSKRVSWDPPIPIEVGSYGVVDRKTGELNVQGCIYDDRFQEYIDNLGLEISIEAHPEEGGTEEGFILATKGATRVVGPQNGFAGLASASLSGQWQFENGRRDALLLMHRPRMKFISAKLLENLKDLPMLKDKWLVTSIYVCPAFAMYLSNKSGERVSLALTGQVPLPVAPGINVGAEGGLDWWTDAHPDLFHKACDKAGNYCYTPLFTLKRQGTWRDRVRSALRIFPDGQQDEPPMEPTVDDLYVIRFVL